LKTSKTFDSGNPTEHFARSKLPAFNPRFDDGSWGQLLRTGVGVEKVNAIGG
jgi:hypothetical protein